MDREPLKVYGQNHHSEGDAGTPEDIGYCDRPESVLRVRLDVRDDATRGCSNDSGDNGQ